MSGHIYAPSAGEIIIDGDFAKGEVILGDLIKS